MSITFSWTNAAKTSIAASDGRQIPADPANADYAQLMIEPNRIGRYSEPMPSKDELLAFAADKRWRVETVGITLSLAKEVRVRVPTDDRAKTLLMGAASTMADKETAPFVTGTSAATLTGAQFKVLFAAVIAHVKACFAAQAEIMSEIAAGKITQRAQIDTDSRWPS